MLPKKKRLNLSKQFEYVRSGKHIDTLNFKLFAKLNSNSPIPLVGIALKKANFKKAVSRNRARRISSMAIEPLYPALRKELNLVMMPKSSILNQKVEDLVQEISNVNLIFSTN